MPTDLSNVELTADATSVVDAFLNHYRAAGKESTGQQYAPKLKQLLKFGVVKGYDLKAPPPTLFEEWVNDRWEGPDLADTRNTNRQFFSLILKNTAAATGSAEWGAVSLGTKEASTKSPAQKKAERESRAAAKAKKQFPTGVPVGPSAAMQYAAGLPGQDPSMSTDFSLPPSVPTVPSNEIPFGGAPDGAPSNGTMQGQGGQQTVRIEVAQPAAKPPKPVSAPALPKGVTYEGVTLAGPYFNISYLADGTNGPAGTYVHVRQASAQQMLQTGDVALFIHQNVLPSVRTPAGASAIQFKVDELNDRRVPTNRFFDVPVAVPQVPGSTPGPWMQGQPGTAAPFHNGFTPTPAHGGGGSPFVDAYARQLEAQMQESQRREREYQKQASESQNQLQMMMFMQQMQAEQQRQRELDNLRRQHEEEQRAKATPLPMLPPPPPPPMPPPPEDPSKAIEAVVNPFAQTLEKLIDRPDPMASMMPMLQMQQQQANAQIAAIQAQAQAQLQMQQAASAETTKLVMTMMQAQQAQAASSAAEVQKILMTMMADKERRAGEETPVERMLRAQLERMDREVQALRQSGETDDDFMDKVLKFEQFKKAIGVEASGSGSFVKDIAEAFPAVMKGFAAGLGSIQARQPPRPAPPQSPPAQRVPPQPAQPPPATPAPADPPPQSAPKDETKPAETSVAALPAPVAEASAPQGPATPAEPSGAFVRSVEAMFNAHEDAQAVLDRLNDLVIATMSAGTDVDKAILNQVLANFRDSDSYEELVITVKMLVRASGLAGKKGFELTEIREVAEVIHANYTAIYAAVFDGREKHLEDEDDGAEEEAA